MELAIYLNISKLQYIEEVPLKLGFLEVLVVFNQYLIWPSLLSIQAIIRRRIDLA